MNNEARLQELILHESLAKRRLRAWWGDIIGNVLLKDILKI